MKANVAIGHTIYSLRLHRGLTAKELAARSRVSNTYISQVEHGKKEPSSAFLALFAEGLGVTVGDILIESGRLMNEWEGYLTSAESKRSVEV